MATLVTRTTDQPDGTTAKGSALTHAEVDANFINLNSDKVEVSGAIVFAAKAGEALTKGDVVYVSGVSGNEPVVSKADADDASKMPAFGLAEADANLNAAVNIVTFGTLYDLDTSAFSAGDTVYVSTTAGGLTATKPAGEASLIQNLGLVIRSHASAGSIKVGGAGRTNAVPNLNDGNVFIGNASNQAETRALVEADISDLQTYLTTESDTLDSVTGRGNTTTNAITVGSLTSTGIDDNATSTAITIDASERTSFASETNRPISAVSTSTNAFVTFKDTNSASIGHVKIGSETDDMVLYANAQERMRIDSSGNVGIGGDGNAKLEVFGPLASPSLGTYNNSAAIISNIAGGYGMSFSVDGTGTGYIQAQNFTSSTAYNLSLNPAGGNVGIKETNPGSDLHITDDFPRITLEDSGDSSISYIDVGGGFLSFTSQTNATTHGKISLKTYNGTTTDTQIEINGVNGYSAFKKAVQEQEYSLTSTVINPANGTIQYKTLGANTTFTKTNWLNGAFVTLMIDDGSAYTVTWPTITWVGGSAPVLQTSGYNVIELWQVNGTLYGAFVGTA